MLSARRLTAAARGIVVLTTVGCLTHTSRADEPPQPASFSVRLGATNRQFWKERRLSKLADRNDLLRSTMASYERFSPDEACDELVLLYRERSQGGAADYGGLEIQALSGQYAKAIALTRVAPLLSEPSFSSSDLTINSLARPGGYFPVLEERSIGAGGLDPPGDPSPFRWGDWARVRTTSGAEGWLPLRTSAVSVIPIPRPAQPSVSPTIPLSLVGTIGLACLIGFVTLLRARGGRKTSTSSSASGTYSGQSDATRAANTGSGSRVTSHHRRQGSSPKQGWFEADSAYSGRIRQEGRERTIEGLTGSSPKQGWLEGDQEYRARLVRENSEAIVRAANDSEPRQGWFESDDSYHSRMSQEANEAVVEHLTGSSPSQGWFESDESYSSRLGQEANEAVIEAATGSDPRQGFFESDEAYRDRVAEEANEARARGRDD